jgi:type II secretory pathway component PulF
MSNVKTYYYRVLLPHGKLSTGVLRLAVEKDQSARLRLERETDGTVVTLWRLPQWVSAGAEVLARLQHRRVRPEDLAGFLRDMGLMLQAGVPTLDALKTLADEGASVGHKAVAQIATRMADDLSSGITVAQSLARYPDVFPETVCNLATIGEQSNTLAPMLREAAEHVERLVGIRRDVRTAMIYPLFVFATIFAVAAFWVYYVVPSMAQLFKQLNAQMPPLTRALVAFSDTVAQHAALSLGLVLIAVTSAIVVVRHVPGARRGMHETLHRIPILQVIMTSSSMAHITEHLAILVRAGLDFVTCLKVLERSTQNLYYQRRLVRVRESVERGGGIADSMRSVGGFPAMAVRMIAVGESSGSLDAQLTHLAVEYRKRLDVLIKSLFELIKPLVILVAGALFLFLVVALLLPVYDLVRQSVNQSLGA